MSTDRTTENAVDPGEGMSEMLTIREACRLLNVHENTLRRWGALGLIKEYRIGVAQQRRFRAEDVTAFAIDQAIFTRTAGRKRSRIEPIL
jgi:excisionase family DNA binding protein